MTLMDIASGVGLMLFSAMVAFFAVIVFFPYLMWILSLFRKGVSK